MREKMSNITYIKGDLFSAPKGSILIHACNCRGLWGGGIAKQFALKFPGAYAHYREICNKMGAKLLGSCFIIPTRNYAIACLFTSKGYGQAIDSPEEILEATKSAVNDLIRFDVEDAPYYACKFNSGLFRVPWEQTEAILLETGKKFTVYEY
jgi:ADP-ribose 1''-phosphate phosphatase